VAHSIAEAIAEECKAKENQDGVDSSIGTLLPGRREQIHPSTFELDEMAVKHCRCNNDMPTRIVETTKYHPSSCMKELQMEDYVL
jgi:hypothetical protein